MTGAGTITQSNGRSSSTRPMSTASPRDSRGEPLSSDIDSPSRNQRPRRPYSSNRSEDTLVDAVPYEPDQVVAPEVDQLLQQLASLMV